LSYAHVEKTVAIEVCYKSWNKLAFGNIHENEDLKQQTLIPIQEEIDKTLIQIRDSLVHTEKQARDNLYYALDC